MNFFCSGNDVVDTIGKWDFSGDVTPPIWYKTIVNEKKKPNYLAAVILADIVYWYRPTVIRDEITGEVRGWKKKFRGDMLQKSYEQWVDKTNENARTIRRAVDLLVQIGVVRRHKRSLRFKNGTVAHNVLFIELVPEKLYELTYPQKEDVVLSDTDTQYAEYGYEIVGEYEEVIADSDADTGDEDEPSDLPKKRKSPNRIYKKTKATAEIADSDGDEGDLRAGTENSSGRNKKVLEAEQNFVPLGTINGSDLNKKLFEGQQNLVPYGTENGSGQNNKMLAFEQKFVQSGTGFGQTNTKNTGETTAQISAQNFTQNTHMGLMDASINPSTGRTSSTVPYENPLITRMKQDIEQMKENIQYDSNMAFWNRNPMKFRDQMEFYEEIYTLMCEVVCSNQEFIRIGKDNIPAFLVREHFLKIKSEHITYVRESLKKVGEIQNIRAYLISCLYHSVGTMATSEYHEIDQDYPVTFGGF